MQARQLKSMDNQLIEAISSGDLDTVTSILNSPTFNKEESNLNAHLSEAISHTENKHAREIVALLLEHGADVNHHPHHVSPLQLAADNAERHWQWSRTIHKSGLSEGLYSPTTTYPHRYRRLQMVALLLAYGANGTHLLSHYPEIKAEIDRLSNPSYLPKLDYPSGKRKGLLDLSLAIPHGDLDTVKSLLPLAKSDNFNNVNSLLRHAMQHASAAFFFSSSDYSDQRPYFIKIIKLFLEHGADPSIVDCSKIRKQIGTTTLEALQLNYDRARSLNYHFKTASNNLRNNPANVLPYSTEALRGHLNGLAKSLRSEWFFSNENKKVEVRAALKKLDEISADGDDPLKITALVLAIRRTFTGLMEATFEMLHLNHHFIPACKELQDNPENMLPCSIAQVLKDQLDALGTLSENFPDKYKKAEVTAALEKLNEVSAQNDPLKITALALAIQRAFPDFGINLVMSRKQREEQLDDAEPEPDALELAELKHEEHEEKESPPSTSDQAVIIFSVLARWRSAKERGQERGFFSSFWAQNPSSPTDAQAEDARTQLATLLRKDHGAVFDALQESIAELPGKLQTDLRSELDNIVATVNSSSQKHMSVVCGIGGIN